MPPDSRAASFDLHGYAPFPDTRQPIRLLLDRSHRIVFVSSAIQAWLGHDYEALPGTPVTSLLPDLQSFPEWQKYCIERRRQPHKPWCVFTFALHADGRYMPAMVSMASDDGSLSIPVLTLAPVGQA